MADAEGCSSMKSLKGLAAKLAGTCATLIEIGSIILCLQQTETFVSTWKTSEVSEECIFSREMETSFQGNWTCACFAAIETDWVNFTFSSIQENCLGLWKGDVSSR